MEISWRWGNASEALLPAAISQCDDSGSAGVLFLQVIFIYGSELPSLNCLTLCWQSVLSDCLRLLTVCAILRKRYTLFARSERILEIYVQYFLGLRYLYAFHEQVSTRFIFCVDVVNFLHWKKNNKKLKLTLQVLSTYEMQTIRLIDMLKICDVVISCYSCVEVLSLCLSFYHGAKQYASSLYWSTA